MPQQRPTKRERRLLARAERSARRRRFRKMQKIRSVVWIIVITGIIGFVFFIIGRDPNPSSSEAASIVSNRYMVEDQGNDHVPQGTLIAHERFPPSSGTHYANPSQHGVFTVPVSEGNWIQNLEQGSIVLLYKCTNPDECEGIAGKIRTVYKSLPKGASGEIQFMATPYTKLPSAYALLAWTWQEDMATLEPARVERFYRDLVDNGPVNN